MPYLEFPNGRKKIWLASFLSNLQFIAQWLEAKSDNWHQKLYALLGDFLSTTPSTNRNRGLYSKRKDKLSGSSIIRLSDRTYESAKNCYFPGEDMERDE